MRILITGGAGFIGSHLARFLLAKHYEVLCMDNFVTGQPENIAPLGAMPGFRFIQQDYAAAAESFRKATTINPEFSQPYNQLGYAYRFVGKYAEAEQAFQKYIALKPTVKIYMMTPIDVMFNAGALPAGDNIVKDVMLAAAKAAAMKNNVPSWLVGESMLQGAEQAVSTGSVSRASAGYSAALDQYRRARREADSLRADAAHVYDRAKTVILALPTGPQRTRATAALTRADSLMQSQDYNLARLASQEAEDIVVATGIAPPSVQPADPQRAVATLLEDLGRAVESERIANLRALFAVPLADRDAGGWQTLFRTANRLTANFTANRVTIRGPTATATVQAVYKFVPTDGGAQRELRPKLAMRFTKTPSGWRIADMRETP